MKVADIKPRAVYVDAHGILFRVDQSSIPVGSKQIDFTCMFAPHGIRSHWRTGAIGTFAPRSFASRVVQRATRKCRFCGCTDKHACRLGCSWFGEGPGLWNVCSECSVLPDAERAIAAIRPKVADPTKAAAVLSQWEARHMAGATVEELAAVVRRRLHVTPPMARKIADAYRKVVGVEMLQAPA